VEDFDLTRFCYGNWVYGRERGFHIRCVNVVVGRVAILSLVTCSDTRKEWMILVDLITTC
jgi:hypothetical protein